MDEYLMISAIQHYSYCPRQCALIHQDQIFTENIFTLQGRYAHERVDERHDETEQDVKKVTSLHVWSDQLRITGICDLVEFRGDQPYPVEYKYGRINKAQIHDELQLCAQAMCLEERLRVSVPEGAIFHYSSRKRRRVSFTKRHREQVKETIFKIQDMLAKEKPPKAVHDARCKHCSLMESCMPNLTNGQKKYDWMKKILEEEKGVDA